MAAPIGRYKNIIWFWRLSEPSFTFIRHRALVLEVFLLALHSCYKKKKNSLHPPTQDPALVMLKMIHRAPGAHIQPARSDWSASTCRHVALFRGSLTYWSSSSLQRCSGRAVPPENTVYFPPLTHLTKYSKMSGIRNTAAAYRKITLRLLFRC